MFGLQQRLTARICEDKKVAAFVAPGYGKTASVLTALLDLGAWPALVVAPARVARRVWREEAAQWEHLRNLRVVDVSPGLREGDPGRRGCRPSTQWAPPEEAHVEAVSYEQFWWLTEQVDVCRRYRAVVYDELSCMKDPGSQRFIRARNLEVSDHVPVVVGLTGRPVGNHLFDIWGEMYCVAGAAPLGPRFTDFKEQYFEQVDYRGYQWGLKHSPDCGRYRGEKCGPCASVAWTERDLARRCSPWSFAVREPPPAKIPPVVPHRVRCDWPAGVARQAAELERQLWTRLDSGEDLEVVGQSAAAQKLRQMGGGGVYVGQEARGQPRRWERVHTSKEEALLEVLGELQGRPLLVFYEYRHEAERLRSLLRGRPGAELDDPGAIESWDRGELEWLLCHNLSARHGLNLQRGGSHLVFWTLPWSWDTYDQCCKRLARPGQSASVVTSHELLCGPVDERVVEVLEAKAGVEARFLNAL